MLGVFVVRSQQLLTRPLLLFKPNQLSNGLFPKQSFNNQSQMRWFRTRSSNEQGINSSIRDSKVFKTVVSAVAGSTLFFTVSTIWAYESKVAIRKEIYNQKSINNFLGPVQQNSWIYGVIILNAIVFGVWRMKKMDSFMYKYFTLSVDSKRTFLPMLLSTFSHITLPHIFLNMLCFQSFAVPVTYAWGKETALPLYLSAGMFGALTSTLFKIYRPSAAAYSVGASSAILGLVASSCIMNPDAKVSIIFLPMFTFSAQNALLGLIALDTMGLVLRWQFLDHAGHLGGTLFGIWYTKYGHKYVNKYRLRVARAWHKIRSKK